MADTCIVCLGDLETGNSISKSSLETPKPEDADHKDDVSIALPAAPPQSKDQGVELIAHLLPCGHDLHDECLKPWVERANSCPICRQSFNTVELSNSIGGKHVSARLLSTLTGTDGFCAGPVIASYVVSDRTQVADIDPSMLIEDYDEDELEDQPCAMCGDDGDEDKLLQCDGCDLFYHIYCVGLSDVPVGHWFCEICDTQRAIESVCPNELSRSTRRPHHTADRRTRGQQRRVRNANQASSSGWARVWQQVWDRLNLDLDFPFDERPNTTRIDRAHRAVSERGGLSQWERRFQVAARQGAANRFRDTASALLDIHAVRERPEPSEPESREEIRAWNALEKAKEIELEPAPKRKRKSTTTSPSDADIMTRPQRPLKRPRTRRQQDNTEAASHVMVEGSVSRASAVAGPSTSRDPSTHNVTASNNGPTFLQSMLKEIETSCAPDESRAARHNMHTGTGHSSPYLSSPAASPITSNHATPRARSLTPPPSLSTLPGSPMGLTSKVEPIYPPPEFSPVRSSPENALAHRPCDESKPRANDHRPSCKLNNKPSPTRSQDSSPTRAAMSLSTKADIQKMVTTALKPHYHRNIVSKDQYTDINRNVSRMLYEKVGDISTLDTEARGNYERLADEEVTKAVRSVQNET